MHTPLPPDPVRACAPGDWQSLPTRARRLMALTGALQFALPGAGLALLVSLVYRGQGLLVIKGNPKNIRGFEDLTRGDVVFVNRQAGAGTRLLTDKCLRELGIKPKDVKGYDREEYTHMGVASAVLTGVADTGLAILASAVALGLDFIPVAKERYDLAIPGGILR